ncbi:interleukin-10 receptor subunit beta-like isoform X2 [Hypanus sabinus]|uniref:interleukin-10 receptor subunit beta-like isoform X2 n=1 Tax=Hypanus sabinus TaxID=79690 RepID=UPI0028C47D80|nr:interleukin-10 receptor subunit beta-like isoform X2 [Hypanus sabinus]
MSAVRHRVTFLFGVLWAIVLGKVPEPENVTISLIQSKRLLRWNPVPFQDGPLTYSVQKSLERGENRMWRAAQNCMQIMETECKLESLALDAPYDLRVRAEHGSETSNWVEAVSAPRNIKVVSYNLKHVMTWEADALQLSPVTYSVQFQGSFERATKDNWTDALNCTHTPVTECDLLDNLAFFAKYHLRVRTELEGATSEWVEIEPFYPYKDTVIGPPSVTVQSEAGVLHVSIKDPVREDERSIRLNYRDLIYNVFYWEKTDDGNINVRNVTTVSSTLLQDLQAWTTYCLKVHAFVPDLSKEGLSSPVTCSSVTANAKRRAIEAAQVLFIALFSVLLITLGCFLFVIYVRRTVKHLMYPSYSLPVHIREYLTESSQQPVFPAVIKDNLQEDHWDKLSIVSRSETSPVSLNPDKANEKKMNQETKKSDLKITNEDEDLESSQSSVDSGHYSNSTQDSSSKNPQNIGDASKT